MGDKYRAKSGNGNAKGTNRGNFQQKGFTAGQTPGLYVLHYDESAHMGLRIEKYHKSLVKERKDIFQALKNVSMQKILNIRRLRNLKIRETNVVKSKK